MNSLFKRVLEHGPRHASARVRSLALPTRADGHVLMLHTGRSGSTVLGAMLDQHKSIFWDGETIEKRLHRMSAQQGVGISQFYGKLTLGDSISHISNRVRRLSGGRHFGLEIQDYQLAMMEADCASFLEEIRKLGFSKFIILDRNPIRKLISHIIAVDRGQHHATAKDKVTNRKTAINPDRVYAGHRIVTFEDALAQYEDFLATFESLLQGEEVLRLSYAEHIEESPLVAYEEVCRFLGLEPQSPAITLRKTTQRNLADVIENYAELESRVLQSRFKDAMLEVMNGKA